jgi:23S rRNA U2552 (ribose-2'-O)-methylase RlmE/FtsJ
VVKLSDGDYRWGAMDGAEAHWMNGRLNDGAHDDFKVECMDYLTGADVVAVASGEGGGGVREGGVDGAAAGVSDSPVSRAFWKMHQTIEEHLQAPQSFGSGWWAQCCDDGSGLDLGASPGGWTQALCGGGSGRLTAGNEDKADQAGKDGGGGGGDGARSMARVLAIDKGTVAERVLDLGGVTHAALDFRTPEAADAIAASAPYSCIVCDANIDADIIVGVISDTLLAAARAMVTPAATAAGAAADAAAKGAAEGAGSAVARGRLFRNPCVFVLTLKFPVGQREQYSRKRMM